MDYLTQLRKAAARNACGPVAPSETLMSGREWAAFLSWLAGQLSRLLDEFKDTPEAAAARQQRITAPRQGWTN